MKSARSAISWRGAGDHPAVWGRRFGAGGRIVLRLEWGREARFGLLVAALAIGGCAQSGSWQNPDVPEEQWSADRADCQTRARDQAEREFALSQQSTRSLNYDLGGQWQMDMNRFSGQRRQHQLFETCMTQLGCRLMPTGGE
ncbi:MAG: hypothetical protein ACM3Q0_07460 [Bacteroidota bacterium]